jgi:hypothetical protein
MLVNPETFQVVRECPLNKGVIACDQLKWDTKFIQELGKYEGTTVHEAFAHFCNEGIINPIGWYQSDDLTFEDLTQYYYANKE